MSNKKVIITMISVIILLLLSVICIAMLKIAGIDLWKMTNKSNITETVAIINVEEDSIIIGEQSIKQNLENNSLDLDNIQFPSDLEIENNLLNMVSSRNDNIDRELYVDIGEQAIQNDYEEIKSYISLQNVQISFNMDVSKPTGLSKEDFVSLVKKMKYDKTGILKANAEVIWESCQKYSVNEIFVLGICGIESAWCSASQHQRNHNYASLMSKGKLIQYSSDAEGFEVLIKLLGQKYLTPGSGLYHGKTITGVGTSYCNTTTWPPKVYKCMQQVFQ